MQKDQPHNKPDGGRITTPPKQSLRDPSGKETDNPKLSKQAEGKASHPSASKSPDPHRGIKRS